MGTTELTIRLNDPGMTALHRVGLAGLYMTLKALESCPSVKGEGGSVERLKKDAGVADGIPWCLDPSSVTLHWNSEPSTFFDALFEESFRLDHGLLYFAALDRPTAHPAAACMLQDAVLNTVLQHGRTRKADPQNNRQGSISVEVDGQPLLTRYRRVAWYAHAKAGKDFEAGGQTPLTGWLLPGGAERHSGLSRTKLEANPGQALSLRYLAIGALYFEIRRRVVKKKIRPRYALIVPDIDDLQKYARIRRHFLRAGVKQLIAAGTAEAGLRVIAELDAAGLLPLLGSASCRVISFGVVPWSKQLKTRVELFDVRARPGRLHAYRLCQNCMALQLKRPEGAEPFWDVPQVPDLVAANVVADRPWWFGFAGFIADRARGRHVFEWERKGLAVMVDETIGSHDNAKSPEHVFVMACHEAWHRRLGQLGDKARRQGSSFRKLVEREFTKRRVELARARNPTTTWAALTDFWSQSGSSLRALRHDWPMVLELLDDRHWQRARDLALLALASYSPRSKEEEQALEQAATELAGGEDAEEDAGEDDD